MKPFKPDSLQQRIEQPLSVEAEAHFVLNTIAKKIIEKKEVLDTEFQLIRNLFIDMQQVGTSGIISKIINLRDTERITTLEMYLIGDYFMVSEQIGPSNSELMDEFFNRDLSPEWFEKKAIDISIPGYTRTLILQCYKKMKGVI